MSSDFKSFDEWLNNSSTKVDDADTKFYSDGGYLIPDDPEFKQLLVDSFYKKLQKDVERLDKYTLREELFEKIEKKMLRESFHALLFGNTEEFSCQITYDGRVIAWNHYNLDSTPFAEVSDCALYMLETAETHKEMKLYKVTTNFIGDLWESLIISLKNKGYNVEIEKKG